MSNASELGKVAGAVTLIKMGATPHQSYAVTDGGPAPSPQLDPNSPFNQRANETGTPFDPDFRPSGHQAAPRSDPQSVHAYREGGALQRASPPQALKDDIRRRTVGPRIESWTHTTNPGTPHGDLPAESFMTPEEVAPLSPQEHAQNAERARQQILTPTARPVQRQAATPLAQSATPAPPVADATMSSSPLHRGNMPGGAPSAASPAPPMPRRQPSVAPRMGSSRAAMPEDTMSLDQIESQDMAASQSQFKPNPGDYPGLDPAQSQFIQGQGAIKKPSPTPAPPVRVSARGFGAGGPIRNIVGARRQNVAQGTTRGQMRRARRGR